MVDYQCKSFYTIQDLPEIVRILRGPGGCPWDREQTHESIQRDFLEEVYEVLEAIRIAKEQGKGAIALRGKMIDAPIVARAERTISMAVEMGLGREA